jgi:hypothetical protein
MRFRTNWGVFFAGIGLMLACHPVVPSETCKRQMSACLAKCNPELDGPNRQASNNLRNTMTTCEKACMTCSGTSSSASPPPVPTPTGTVPEVPPGAIAPPPGVAPGERPDAGPGPAETPMISE